MNRPGKRQEGGDRFGPGEESAAVSQYEHGLYQPRTSVLAKMALALGMPTGFFLTGRQSFSTDRIPAHFRSLRSTTLRDRRRALAHATFAWNLATKLEEFLRLPTVNFPHAVLPEYPNGEDIETLALRCRQLFDLGSGPVPNVVRLLESRGAVAVSLPVYCRKVDAFSCKIQGRPIVLLNAEKDEPARVRHSAAHELGHIVAHHDVDPGNQQLERQADAFAAAFLLPADEIAPQLPSSLQWRRLIKLRMHWGVSIASLLVRARNLGVLSEYSYRRGFTLLNTRRNSDGSLWRIKEPGDLGPAEQPILFRKCVDLIEEGGVTRADLAKDLSLPLSLLDQLVGDDGRPHVNIDYKTQMPAGIVNAMPTSQK